MKQIQLFKNNDESLFESKSNLTDQNADTEQSTTSLKSVTFPAPVPNQAPVITGPSVFFTDAWTKGLVIPFSGALLIRDIDNGGNWNDGALAFSVDVWGGNFLANNLFPSSSFKLENGVIYFGSTAISKAFQITSGVTADPNQVLSFKITFNASATNEIVQSLLQSMVVVQKSDSTFVNIIATDRQNAQTNYNIKLDIEKAPVITPINWGGTTIENNKTKSFAEIISALYDPNGPESWKNGTLKITTEGLDELTSTLPKTSSNGFWASQFKGGADIFFGTNAVSPKVATLNIINDNEFSIQFNQAIEDEAIKDLLSYFHFSKTEGGGTIYINAQDGSKLNSQTATIYVNAVEPNTPPTIVIDGSEIKLETKGEHFSIPDLSVSDIDGDWLTLTILLPEAYDTNILELTGSDSGSGPGSGPGPGPGMKIQFIDGTKSFKYSASQEEINSLLEDLQFFGNIEGSKTITIKVTDDRSEEVSKTFKVTYPLDNTAPTTSNIAHTVNEDSAFALTLKSFPFSDVDTKDSLQSITITSLPIKGSLKLNGSAVTVNQVITANDIAAGKLVFTPAANANGNNYANFGFKVSDGIALSNAASVTINVTPINDAPTGIVSIQGASERGQTLTVSNTLADVDGLGSINYQWLADGVAIGGANSTSLVLSRSLVGKKISVQASYTDGAGTLERVQSTQTSAVMDINTSFRGNVSINGQATQGEVLTATNNLSDPDGMGNVVYQWNSNGIPITGANQATLKLDESLVGKLISVTASFTDGKGNLESASNGLNRIVGSNVQGSTSNDVFKGTAGYDIFNGGAGTDTVQFNGKLADYTIKNVNGKFIVTDKSGNDGIDTLSNIETLKFADMSMNLTIQGKLPSAPSAGQLKLIELYIAFFNRIPDADGLSYWIDQFNGGTSIVQIAESFYQAGLAYSKETGYTSTMSNADFVNIIYKNTLGRKEGADAEGLKYWTDQLATGKATRGSLVNDILNSAHTLKGKADYGWVADLLDNKVTVGKTVAVDWGINFNTPEESISKGMAIAAAVTATDYQAALKLVGLNSIDIGLTGVAPLETGFALM